MDTPVARSRRPAVAGYYYARETDALHHDVARLLGAVGQEAACGVIVPHDSHRRSGPIAGAVLGRVAVPRRCVIVGPPHALPHGSWRLMVNGAYRTPLGEVPIDERLAHAWRARCPWLTPDATGHLGEHAIEVLIPFLQRRAPAGLTIVPLIAGSEDRAALAATAVGLAQIVRLVEEPVLLIASASFSHFELEARTRAQDRLLVEAVGSLDGAAFLEAVRESGATVCGEGAVALVLDAARALGARRASCVAYATSAEAGGDPDAAVGYAGISLQ